MTKVLTFLCESCNLGDSEDIDLSDLGFQKLRFDMRPANTSDEALYHLQTFSPMERRNRKEIFTRTPEFLACHAKTRIFGDIWLPNFAVWNLDPLTKSDKPISIFSRHKSEPDNEIFRNFLDFMENEFHRSEYRHAIYLSILGHIGNREGEENRGIPATLSKTLSRLMEVFRQHVGPLVDWDNTFVFIHPDHGTKRMGVSWETATHDGFLWFRHPQGKQIKPPPFANGMPVATWKNILATICEILEVELPKNESVSLLRYA